MKIIKFNIYGLLIAILFVVGCNDGNDLNKSRTGFETSKKAILTKQELKNLEEVQLKYDSLINEHQIGLYFDEWEYDERSKL